MCLSPSERRELRGIGRAVRQSDPRLDSMLSAFDCLNAAEPRPPWETLPPTRRRMLTGLDAVIRAAVGR